MYYALRFRTIASTWAWVRSWKTTMDTAMNTFTLPSLAARNTRLLPRPAPRPSRAVFNIQNKKPLQKKMDTHAHTQTAVAKENAPFPYAHMSIPAPRSRIVLHARGAGPRTPG